MFKKSLINKIKNRVVEQKIGIERNTVIRKCSLLARGRIWFGVTM